MNVKEIRKMPNNSITDPDTIREIAKHGIETGDSSLDIKIKRGFEFCGLYPYDIKIINIKPEIKNQI